MEILDGAILVGVEHLDSEGTLTIESVATLKCARSLTSGPVFAVSVTSLPDVDALGECGVKQVFVPIQAAAWQNDSAFYADFVRRVIDREPVCAVLLPASSLSTEVAARLGVKLGSSVVDGVTSFEIIDGGIVASKRVLGGEWEASTAVSSAIPVFTVLVKEDELEPVDAVVTSVQSLEVMASAPGVQVISAESQGNDGALSSADVAVIGGRGVDGNFDLVRSLADALDGAVGATRVACDEGWADRSLQVGQTGISISPNVYVGLGVSGAIHHTCGIQGAGTIVAICDDPDAPIFEIADFGVVGAVEDVVPQVIKHLSELRS